MENLKKRYKQPLNEIISIISKLGWKRLDNWARNYYVNPHEGKIYSVSKTSGKLKQLNSKPGSNGYCTVKLKGLDGKYHTKSEHKLIVDAYYPPDVNKPLCHHKDHDRTNNRLSNLERISYKSNSRRRKDNERN